jgi:hypothetical protein
MRRELGTDRIGTFEVKSGKLVVSDPCYTRGTWCAGVLENVRNGTWMAEVGMSDEGDWGTRVAALKVFAKGFENHRPNELMKFEVGVDSGQVCIADEAVYPQGEPGEYGDLDTFYGRACAATGDVAGVGIFENGRAVNSSSGYGDGSYTGLVARNPEGEIVAVEVLFIEEEEDEDYSEDYEDIEDDEDDLEEDEDDDV